MSQKKTSNKLKSKLSHIRNFRDCRVWRIFGSVVKPTFVLTRTPAFKSWTISKQVPVQMEAHVSLKAVRKTLKDLREHSQENVLRTLNLRLCVEHIE